MQEKLIKATNELGGEVESEESIQVPGIGLLLRIQVALDERQIFPENSTINILDIINKIPDKNATAWQEKLKGENIDSQQARVLTDCTNKRMAGQRTRKKTAEERTVTLHRSVQKFCKTLCQNI